MKIKSILEILLDQTKQDKLKENRNLSINMDHPEDTRLSPSGIINKVSTENVIHKTSTRKVIHQKSNHLLSQKHIFRVNSDQ